MTLALIYSLALSQPTSSANEADAAEGGTLNSDCSPITNHCPSAKRNRSSVHDSRQPIVIWCRILPDKTATVVPLKNVTY